MPMPKWLANSFSQVFQLDGYDENFKTINGVKVKNLDAESYQAALIYHQSILVRILTYFGFPMRMRFGQKATIGAILATAALNFIGWPDENTSKAQFLLMPFKLVANLLNLVFALIIRPVMLVTELLPLALQKLCNEKKDEVDNWFGKKILGLIAGIMGITHFIGRAITSPISGVRQAYEEGREYGFILAGVSLLFSVSAWTAMIFVAPMLLPQAWAFVSTNFPAVANVLSTIYSSVANLVSPIITPVIELLMPHLMPYLMPVMGWMATTAAPWLTSFFALFGFTGTIPGAAIFLGAMGAAAGVFVTTVGTGINLLYRTIADALTGRALTIQQAVNDLPQSVRLNGNQLLFEGPTEIISKEGGVIRSDKKIAIDLNLAIDSKSISNNGKEIPLNGLASVKPPFDRENLTTAKLSEVLGKRVADFEGLELTDGDYGTRPLLKEKNTWAYSPENGEVDFANGYRGEDQRVSFSPRGN